MSHDFTAFAGGYRLWSFTIPSQSKFIEAAILPINQILSCHRRHCPFRKSDPGRFCNHIKHPVPLSAYSQCIGSLPSSRTTPSIDAVAVYWGALTKSFVFPSPFSRACIRSFSLSPLSPLPMMASTSSSDHPSTSTSTLTSAPHSNSDASTPGPTPDQPRNEPSPPPTPQPPQSVSPNHHDSLTPENPSHEQISPDQPPSRFTISEEEHLISEANALKATANATFARGDFSSAITHYDRALATCPTYLDYEVAVLKSNIAACHLKLQEWKEAIECATASLDCLERLLPSPKPKPEPKAGQADAPDGAKENHNSDENNSVVELEGDDETVSAALEQLNLSDQRKADILRIRSKSLLRRARARSQLTTWSELQGAEDDYRTLASMPELPISDRKVVDQALIQLPGQVKQARDREVGEMMGKLKELGNTCLKPFGLSTDMFKVQQGEGGGYSISMNNQ